MIAAGAAILLANVLAITSAKAWQYADKTWLIIPSHYNGMYYHPTIIRTFHDNPRSFATEDCVIELERIGNQYPYSLCTVNYETVRLFTRLY